MGMFFTSMIGPIRNQPLILIKNEIIDNSIRSTYISTLSFFVLLINSVLLSFVGMLFGYNESIGLGVLFVIVLFGGLCTFKNVIPLKKNA